MTSTLPPQPPVNEPTPSPSPRSKSPWLDPTCMRGAIFAGVVGGFIVWILVEVLVTLLV
jgi:hypothetical protein